MRKWFVIFGFLLLVPFAYGQRKTCNGRVFDGITFQPLIGASVYNMNTQKFAFTDKNGQFSIMVSLNDTLVISKSIYRQLVVTVNDKIYSGLEDFFLYYKATMLKEVTIITKGWRRPSFLKCKRPTPFTNPTATSFPWAAPSPLRPLPIYMTNSAESRK